MHSNYNEKYVHISLWGEFVEWFRAGAKTKYKHKSVQKEVQKHFSREIYGGG